MFIDISKWNGVFDWNKALAMGVDGAYIKASEGLHTDPLFRMNSAGCPLKWRGAYHFLCYDYGCDGAKQADYVVNLIKGWQYNLPVALDIEPSSAYSKPFVLTEVLAVAMDFVKRYKELTGHNPVIYVSSSRTKAMKAFTECPLWVAHYTQADKPSVYSWSEYVLWQYSSTGEGKLYGNEAGNRHIDLNRIGKPIETWAIGDPFDALETQPGIFKAQCTADRLIIRSAPYISSETDTGKRLSHGDIREVTKVQGDWYAIADGWVSALYMARISEPAGLTLEERVAALEKAVFGSN